MILAELGWIHPITYYITYPGKDNFIAITNYFPRCLCNSFYVDSRDLSTFIKDYKFKYI